MTIHEGFKKVFAPDVYLHLNGQQGAYAYHLPGKKKFIKLTLDELLELLQLIFSWNEEYQEKSEKMASQDAPERAEKSAPGTDIPDDWSYASLEPFEEALDHDNPLELLPKSFNGLLLVWHRELDAMEMYGTLDTPPKQLLEGLRMAMKYVQEEMEP